MKKRSITITLEKAREWYNSGNTALKDLALQAFSRDEIIYHFTKIKSLNDACIALGLDYKTILVEVKSIEKISKASAAMFELNIIRKALNCGQDLHLTKDPEGSYLYYPYNPFVTKSSTRYKSWINLGEMEVIGKIKCEGEEYCVLCGGAGFNGHEGLGNFDSNYGVGDAHSNVWFLGCATKEIAKYFGKYFGMLITEAKYGDLEDFEIIEEKYKI